MLIHGYFKRIKESILINQGAFLFEGIYWVVLKNYFLFNKSLFPS